VTGSQVKPVVSQPSPAIVRLFLLSNCSPLMDAHPLTNTLLTSRAGRTPLAGSFSFRRAPKSAIFSPPPCPRTPRSLHSAHASPPTHSPPSFKAHTHQPSYPAQHQTAHFSSPMATAQPRPAQGQQQHRHQQPQPQQPQQQQSQQQGVPAASSKDPFDNVQAMFNFVVCSLPLQLCRSPS
jgi:hypothetical protein